MAFPFSRTEMTRPPEESPHRRRPTEAQRAAPAADPLDIAREEDALCERVVGHLKGVRPSRPPPRYDDDQALLSLRDQIASARLEDVPALMAQMERVQAVANQRSQQSAEPVDRLSPYFGHLRLRERGRGTRDVLIGKTTYIEPRADVRIVDWRHAPVSQLYYRYEEGARYEETFGEREIEGEILARRTVTIRDGQLERIAAPQGVYVRGRRGDWHWHAAPKVRLAGGEGTALRAEHLAGRDHGELDDSVQQQRGWLGSSTPIEQREDRHLPEIAALLDPRQFDLISRPDSGLVVVKGAAGSGKTTIGVHRMAFLAYQAPGRFSLERMLVVVGTPALKGYIGQLLEALGLGGMRVVTCAEWAAAARKLHYPWLEVATEDNTPPEVARLKADPAVLHLLEQRASTLDPKAAHDPKAALWLWAEVLTDREGLLEAFAARRHRGMSPADIDRAWQYCSDRCPAVVEWTPKDPSAPAETEGPNAGVGADGREEEEDDRARLDVEDDALLLRAHQLVVGPLRGRRGAIHLEHLFVDEAQDLAPVDLAVLIDLVTDQKCITLAGDTDQRLRLDTGFANWGKLLEDLGMAHVAVEPLRVAYRSTREVMEVARAVLGPLCDPEVPTAPRTGAPVEHHNFPSTGAAAAFLAEALRPLFNREPRASVAVLTRYPEQADAYFEALRMAEVPRLNRIRDYEFSFRPGVEVTEIRQVKGLEYDYVILVDVNAATFPTDDESRYLLHIGATRAAHQLWLLSTGSPSPLIPAALDRDPA